MSSQTVHDLSIPELLRVLNEKLSLAYTRARETRLPAATSIPSLETDIESLEARAYDVLRLIPSLRNLLQPVNRLSPEILSRITRCLLSEGANWDVSSIIPLTHVCRYWRESIISTPKNWMLISSEQEGLAALSLERCKAAPFNPAQHELHWSRPLVLEQGEASPSAAGPKPPSYMMSDFYSQSTESERDGAAGIQLPSWPVPQRVLVPQRMFRIETSSKRKFRPNPPIKFAVGDQDGMSLQDAIDEKYEGLIGRDDEMVFDFTAISLRIEWPQYETWGRHINTVDWRKPRRPITRSKLAFKIANIVDAFIKFNQANDIGEERWRVGSGHIELKDLVLDDIEHMTKGSWQPRIFAVLPPMN